MRRALVIAGLLIVVAVPSYAGVSGSSLIGRRLDNRLKTPSNTTPGAGATSDPLAVDPEIGTKDVREGRTSEQEPGHPVPEPSTMAITSMGLLAAAAFQRKRAK